MNDDQGKCKRVWDTALDDARVSIGDINLIGVQNDLDKLVKNALTDFVDSMPKPGRIVSPECSAEAFNIFHMTTYNVNH